MGVVDIDIVPRGHAILSASSADRWLTCTPSARIEEMLEDKESSFANDGTAAHALAELRLRWLLGQITKDEYLAGYAATKLLHAEAIKDWELPDWEAINSYVRYVLDEAKRLDATVLVEARVDYSKYAQEGFGTSDALLISTGQGVIKSIDLKFGKGVPVNAMNNSQAKLYALGGLLAVDPAGEIIHTVEWTIHQPRLDYIGSDSMTYDELIEWAEKVVAPAAKLAWEGKGSFKPSDKACRFCKAKATCRARAAENVLIARGEFMSYMDKEGKLAESMMDANDIARILPEIDGWINWANALKEHALKEARDKGVKIPGYKLVRGRSSRSWDSTKDIAEELKALGVSETIIYTDPAVRSAPQIEKLVGKASFTKDIAPKLVITPPGAPTLVPEEDSRTAIDAVGEAVAAFAVTESKTEK